MYRRGRGNTKLGKAGDEYVLGRQNCRLLLAGRGAEGMMVSRMKGSGIVKLFFMWSCGNVRVWIDKFWTVSRV